MVNGRLSTRKVVLVALLLVTGAALAQQQPPVGDPGWPRVFTGPAGEQVTVYQPQLLSWPKYLSMDFLIAMSILPNGQSKPYVGSVQTTVDTETDVQNRTVVLTNPQLKKMDFPGVNEAGLEQIRRTCAFLVRSGTKTISLDRVLPAAVKLDTETKGVPVKYDPPVVFYSEKPALLVLLDGEPVLSPIEGTGLMYAVNTNWDLFFEQATSSYYLRDDKSWLTTTDVTKAWQPAAKLPAGLSKLPADDNWKDVKAALPGVPMAAKDVPVVFTSTKPAELIVFSGRPQFSPISGTTGLMYVANTEADVFLHTKESKYYLLVSGRWFSCADPSKGQWTSAAESLPAEFAKIPANSPKAYVLASVPGTEQAKEAVIMAQIPQTAAVKTSEAKVTVTYDGAPKFAPIEGTQMQYATNTPYQVIRVGDMYYCCFQGVWFVSTKAEGPWAVTGKVPAEIYTVPPSCPVYSVTNVTVVEDNSDDGEVVFALAAGLMLGMVIADNGCCVYGTGWYYPPYMHYPVYYPWPPSYGCGAHYDPVHGVYYGGARYYGPYGGAGWGASYNPHTGTYARGAAAYGPYRAGAVGAAYNPYTGGFARGGAVAGPNGSASFIRGYDPSTGRGGAAYSRSNPYASWGGSVVTHGNDWAKGGYYTSSAGSIVGGRTSEGTGGAAWDTKNGSGFAIRGEDNTYAGHDGNVYRKTDNGWQKYDDGSWGNVQQPGVRPSPATASRGASAKTLDTSVATQLNRESQIRTTGQQRTRTFENTQRTVRAGGGRRR